MCLMTVSKRYDCFTTSLMYVNIYVCVTCASMHYIHIVKEVASFRGLDRSWKKAACSFT